MNKWQSVWVGVVWLCAVGPAGAEISVHFDQPVYEVVQGQSVQVQVILDADDQAPGDQPLTEGLVSMSFEVALDQAGLEASSVDLPTALMNDGFNGPPRIELDDPGFARVRAAVFFLASEFYMGEDVAGGAKRMRLATVQIVGQAVGEFDLGLGLWQPAGAADEGFVDGQRTTLDGQILYRGATVRVVPEPATAGLLAAAAGWGLRRRRVVG